MFRGMVMHPPHISVLVDPTVTERKKSKKRIEFDDSFAPIVRRI
jgi:hypothetical protein